MRGLLSLSLALLPLLLGSASVWSAEKPIPPAPQYYVLDEPHILDDRSLRAMEDLLIEHDQATGEQILVAIFNSLDGQDLNDYTNRVFQAWKIGQRGKDNGVLLAVFEKEHQARIEVGYGLEPLLTDVTSSRILREALVPAMQAGRPEEAIRASTLRILNAIDSPLIQSGRATQILSSGDFARHRAAYAARMQNGQVGWVVWLFLGLILMSIVWNSLTSAEAHFTSGGWYRPRPWQRRWTSGPNPSVPGTGGFIGGSPWGMGGGGGGWGSSGGGGGGFIGGGGSSGGGGASAGW